MHALDRAIINGLQGELPICERPYLAAAERLGMSEAELITRCQHMLQEGVLTRVGPMYQIERMGGAFTLAALHAASEDFDRVAELVNAFPQVAHNYERDHHLNMWFVIATETTEEIAQVILSIEKSTGCKVLNFPKSREYFVELKLRVED
jgi:DNA-binding Lrp family transcriptional regulator